MAFKNFHVKNVCKMTSGCIFKITFHASFEKSVHLNQIRFVLYHERERKNEENANFVHIVHILAKLCNIFDEAFLIDFSKHIHVYTWSYGTEFKLNIIFAKVFNSL